MAHATARRAPPTTAAAATVPRGAPVRPPLQGAQAQHRQILVADAARVGAAKGEKGTSPCGGALARRGALASRPHAAEAHPDQSCRHTQPAHKSAHTSAASPRRAAGVPHRVLRAHGRRSSASGLCVLWHKPRADRGRPHPPAEPRWDRHMGQSNPRLCDVQSAQRPADARGGRHAAAHSPSCAPSESPPILVLHLLDRPAAAGAALRQLARHQLGQSTCARCFSRPARADAGERPTICCQAHRSRNETDLLLAQLPAIDTSACGVASPSICREAPHQSQRGAMAYTCWPTQYGSRYPAR